LLVAIDWLFSDANDFLAMHTRRPGAAVQPSADDGVPLGEDVAKGDARRVRLAELLKSGASATPAAKQLGIDVATAMAWAASGRVQVQRRPQVLKPAVRVSLVRCLRQGMDKANAAERHGISIETVTRLLHTEIGLHAAWKAARTVRGTALGSRCLD
jgi:hypothetical protein